MDRYICFYTNSPFWTGDKPDLAIIGQDSDLFTSTMSERTLEYEDENAYIAFCKDGMIMTRIKKLEEKKAPYNENNPDYIGDLKFTLEYLSYLNAVQLLLDSANLRHNGNNSFRNTPLSSTGEVFLAFDNGGQGMPSHPSTQGLAMGRYLNFYGMHGLMGDTRILLRQPIPKVVFDECFKNLSIVINDYEAIQLLDQINSAVSDFKNLKFRQSLIQSWFVIEYFLNKKWVRFLKSAQSDLDSGKKRINKDRRTNLMGRDYTSSIMANMLELNGLIDFDLFEHINRVRANRNSIVHNLELVDILADELREKPSNKKQKDPEIDSCAIAFHIIHVFMMEEYGLELRFTGGYVYSPL